jgi:hypothetical protein
VAREERVVAGRFPGRRKENGNPCLFPPLYGNVRREGMNIQLCNISDRVVHAGQLCPRGRRVLTSMTSFISNLSTSNEVMFCNCRGVRSRMPLSNAPDESSGGPKATKGGLSNLMEREYGSLPGCIFLSDFVVARGSFLTGLLFFSFELRR